MPVHRTEGDYKGCQSRLDLTESPRDQTLAGHPRWPILPISASCPHTATPLRQDAWDSGETKW